MRKTCKNHPKNEPKTHQKSSKNRPKKHTEKTTTQKQPKVSRRVTKIRPTREGKGGIQDGILLEKKKRILQKPNLLRGKGACGKEARKTLRSSTRSAGPRPAWGRILVACGNSSAPGPREDILHAKSCKKFDIRVNAGRFLANFCLKK